MVVAMDVVMVGYHYDAMIDLAKRNLGITRLEKEILCLLIKNIIKPGTDLQLVHEYLNKIPNIIHGLTLNDDQDSYT